MQIKGSQEIEVIAGEFSNMLSEINNLTENLIDTTSILYETKLQRQQSELDYLKTR